MNTPENSPWSDPQAEIDWKQQSAAPNLPRARHSYLPRAPYANPLRPPNSPAEKFRPLIVGAISIVALGLILVLVLSAMGMMKDSTQRNNAVANNPPDQRPPLAKLCPAPNNAPSRGIIQPAPPGPRIEDHDAGISYQGLGDPFHPWEEGVWAQGELGVKFMTGYELVTEVYLGGRYLASMLSGSVPATVGDSLTLNLECAGKQVAEDVRRAYYPQPNTKEDIRNEYTNIGGLPAWVSIFHLTFATEGLKAHGEFVAVVTLDVGRPRAAVLYASLPDTHQQYRADFESVISSIRPA